MPPPATATAVAHPNIALIKFWGVRDADLNLPANGSLSITLDGLATQTSVSFSDSLPSDELILNDAPADSSQTARVSRHLDRVRQLAQADRRARVVSRNDFPASAGIASSASGFAALTLAAASALGLDLSGRDLSILARKGSGSAARSVFGGYVVWHMGQDDETSYAETLWPAEHWNLEDWVAVVDSDPKKTSSRDGHRLAADSPLQEARLSSAPERLAACKTALAERDFAKLATVVELDSQMMHAVMMTSSPPLLYWAPGSIGLMRKIADWRRGGLDVCYTLDAGPTVHCITTAESSSEVEGILHAQTEVVDLYHGVPGPAANLSSPSEDAQAE
jgi:diphosphomevalonate decarboxylase